ncbi:extensin-like [Arabidopsis lyrata subsp. lyrata]|uniref:extensin-like n=1 Tax=Arabidopsis lyrata subsp. lyrata TaxID=81972 RepID=UPI000A29A37A|nr:extensin-like [Arabidopsis lyrata subsp. lyrata]|eukprot:XP_020874089.1 extensin-like [Arabidopsis lyrata subsp. lyrata]
MRSSRMIGVGHCLVVYVVVFSAIAAIVIAYDSSLSTPQYTSPYPPKKYSPYPSESPPPPPPQYRRQEPMYVPHPESYVYSSPSPLPNSFPFLN